MLHYKFKVLHLKLYLNSRCIINKIYFKYQINSTHYAECPYQCSINIIGHVLICQQYFHVVAGIVVVVYTITPTVRSM